jgi:hypothetical protein
MEGTHMKRLLACLPVLIGFVLAGCEEFEEREGREVRLNDGAAQVQVIAQQ